MNEVATIVVCSVLIIVGMIGIVLPVLPGLLLTLLAVLIWAVSTGGSTAWGLFALAAVVYVAGVAAQFLLPGRRLKAQGIGMGTLLMAVLGGIIGFFVIPVVGLPVGFVGAAEAKEALVKNRHGLAYLTVTGRRGGSAMAAAAINAMLSPCR